MPDYLVKWKGQSSGPYSIEDLRRMFEDREIGPMYEISFEGTWITARTFFRRNAASHSGRPSHNPAANGPSGGAARASSFPPPSQSGRTPSITPIRVTPLETPTSTDKRLNPASHGTTARGSTDLIFLAGFWQRATAFALDLLVIAGLPIWAFDAFGSHDLFTFSGLLGISLETWIISSGCFLFGFWIYSTLLEASPLRATFGKRALGLIVVRQSGEFMSFPTAGLRAIAKIGSAAMLLTGFLLAAFSPRKQAFHDLVSGTAVVYPLPAALQFH